MNYKLLVLIIALLLVLPIVNAIATDNTLIYTIINGDTIVDHTLSFSEEQNNLKIKIPLDSEAIEVKNISFSTTDFEDYKMVLLKEPAKYINIKYITGSLVERTKDRFFIVNLDEIKGNRKITAILPEGATLKYRLDSSKSSIVPYAKDITTDGKRITITWTQEELAYANSLLIIYNEQSKGLTITNILVGLAVILLIVIGFVNYRFLSRKKKVEKKSVPKPKISKPDITKDITRNLFEEEKAIVEILLKAKNNELWQKSLQFETGISKVKLSRKLRALEHKGVIEKIPFGNTNKIRLKK